MGTADPPKYKREYAGACFKDIVAQDEDAEASEVDQDQIHEETGLDHDMSQQENILENTSKKPLFPQSKPAFPSPKSKNQNKK